MLQLLGYPEWVASEQGIDEFYAGVSTQQKQNFIKSKWFSPKLFFFINFFFNVGPL